MVTIGAQGFGLNLGKIRPAVRSFQTRPSRMTKLLRASTMSVTSLRNLANRAVIRFPRFCGEPDGGLLWDGEDFPFAILEVGYDDCGEKTRGRSIHWLTRGAGRVCPSLSIKITAANYTLQTIEVDSYNWSDQPLGVLFF